IRVDAQKVRDSSGNRLTDIQVTFQITFPAGEHGDNARAVLPDAVKRSHDRLCTVGRTVELGTPITTKIESGPSGRQSGLRGGNQGSGEAVRGVIVKSCGS